MPASQCSWHVRFASTTCFSGSRPAGVQSRTVWSSACGGQGRSRRRQAAACSFHQGELQLCMAPQSATFPLALKLFAASGLVVVAGDCDPQAAQLRQKHPPVLWSLPDLPHAHACEWLHRPPLLWSHALLCPRPGAHIHLSACPQHLSYPVQVLEYMAGQSTAAGSDVEKIPACRAAGSDHHRYAPPLIAALALQAGTSEQHSTMRSVVHKWVGTSGAAMWPQTLRGA